MYARVERPRDLESLGDAELVRLLKLGHEDTLDVLLKRHSDSLYRFSCHLMSNREDAEDIYQETMARALTRADSLQSGSAFRSWLFSIARNLSVDSYRSKKRTCALPDDESLPLPLYGETPQDRIEISEEHASVAEALSKLAHSHQKVLVLREVNGLSYASIAEEMNVSQSAVETLLFRARRRLREEYSKSAVPAIAIFDTLRDIAIRLAAPLVGGSAVAKVAVTGAVMGTTLIGAPQMVPSQRAALGAITRPHTRPQHAAIHRAAGVAPQSRVALLVPSTLSALQPRPATLSHPSQTVVHRATSHPQVVVRRVTTAPRAVRHHAHARLITPPAPPPVPHARPAKRIHRVTSVQTSPPPPPSGPVVLAAGAPAQPHAVAAGDSSNTTHVSAPPPPVPASPLAAPVTAAPAPPTSQTSSGPKGPVTALPAPPPLPSAPPPPPAVASAPPKPTYLQPTYAQTQASVSTEPAPTSAVVPAVAMVPVAPASTPTP